MFSIRSIFTLNFYTTVQWCNHAFQLSLRNWYWKMNGIKPQGRFYPRPYLIYMCVYVCICLSLFNLLASVFLSLQGRFFSNSFYSSQSILNGLLQFRLLVQHFHAWQDPIIHKFLFVQEVNTAYFETWMVNFELSLQSGIILTDKGFQPLVFDTFHCLNGCMCRLAMDGF